MQFSRRWWLASKNIHHQWNMTGVTKNRYPGIEKLGALMSLLICAFLIAVVGVNWCWCHFWSGGAVLSASHFQRAWHPESHSMFASNLLSTCHVWECFSWSPLVNTAWQFLPVLKRHTLAKILPAQALLPTAQSCREWEHFCCNVELRNHTHSFEIYLFSWRILQCSPLSLLQGAIAFNKCFHWFEWDRGNLGLIL